MEALAARLRELGWAGGRAAAHQTACWLAGKGWLCSGYSLLSTRQQNLPDGPCLPAAPAPQSSSTRAPAAGCTACATPSSPSRRPRRRAAWAHRTSSSTPPSQTRCALRVAWAGLPGLPRGARCCSSPALQLGLQPAVSLLLARAPRFCVPPSFCCHSDLTQHPFLAFPRRPLCSMWWRTPPRALRWSRPPCPRWWWPAPTACARR